MICMKTLVKIIWILFLVIFLVYLFLPNPEFPTHLPDALQSREPADTETTMRRAYFTNLDREEVMTHYVKAFRVKSFLSFLVPTYRLNYPPEESASLIRDQTRSTFLEEITHPFRESIYINGFEPKEDKDRIFIEEKEWRQKIIVRYVPSNVRVRAVVGLLAFLLASILLKEWAFSISKFNHRKKHD